MSIDPWVSGGYAVPAEIERTIEERVVQQNPFRQLVKVVQVGTSSYSHLVRKNDAGSGWVVEAGSRSETPTSDLVQCAPTFGEVYAYPKATEEAMQDIYFDVGNWLAQEAADAFSATEATAIVSGNGTAKPSGFLNTTPTTDDDTASPERAAHA
jgi:HK97 family phage major capsid protein